VLSGTDDGKACGLLLPAPYAVRSIVLARSSSRRAPASRRRASPDRRSAPRPRSGRGARRVHRRGSGRVRGRNRQRSGLTAAQKSRDCARRAARRRSRSGSARRGARLGRRSRVTVRADRPSLERHPPRHRRARPPPQPKGRKQRIALLQAAAVLRVSLAERDSPPAEPLFPDQHRQADHPQSARRRIAKHSTHAAARCQSLTTKTITPHVVRQTAMRLLHAGIDTNTNKSKPRRSTSTPTSRAQLGSNPCLAFVTVR
jgi:hypothetical protein